MSYVGAQTSEVMMRTNIETVEAESRVLVLRLDCKTNMLMMDDASPVPPLLCRHVAKKIAASCAFDFESPTDLSVGR